MSWLVVSCLPTYPVCRPGEWDEKDAEMRQATSSRVPASFRVQLNSGDSRHQGAASQGEARTAATARAMQLQ